MNLFWKIIFFSLVFVIAFVPGGFVVSFILILLYYDPSIIKSICDECKSNFKVEEIEFSKTEYFVHPTARFSRMEEYSDDTREDMK